MTDTTLDAAASLRRWLDDAWARHDTAPRELAAELSARAATLPDDASGAEALCLARHTMLAHLADRAGLQALLDAAPRGARLDEQHDRARWALAFHAGQPTDPLPAAVRCGLIADVAQAWLLDGRVDAASSALPPLEAAMADDPDDAARRAYAASCHNLCLALRTGPRGDARRDALMIDMARLSRRAWQRAGTWMHVERADYQLAMCHASIGQGPEAVAHAQACLARCEAEGADAAERFYAHECNVHAQRAAGDPAWATAHRQRMEALLAEIEDGPTRMECAQTLAGMPAS